MDEIDEKKVTHLIIISVLLSLFVGVGVWAIFDHAVALRLKDDFYPFDRSFVGPNILAAIVQGMIVTLVVSALYPPIRHAIEKWVKKHKDEVMAHVSSENKFLHEKLDHVIKHHPDIPEFKGKK